PVWWNGKNIYGGQEVLEAYDTNNWTFVGNVVAGSSGGIDPPGNVFGLAHSALGLVDYLSCNGDGITDFAKYGVGGAYPPGAYNVIKCALSPTSPYKNAATDGKDVGADIPTVLSKTAGVDQ
ncbi:MAG TPA: hypothetical protein VGQ71_11275, partial [Terriglobales bacterium]|nr:hypothetical protein [Terriglobales bacterium]